MTQRHVTNPSPGKMTDAEWDALVKRLHGAGCVCPSCRPDRHTKETT